MHDIGIAKNWTSFADTRFASQQNLLQPKNRLRDSLAMSEENNLGLMIMMGRAVIDLNRVPSLEEVYEKINDVRCLNASSVSPVKCLTKTSSATSIIEPKH